MGTIIYNEETILDAKNRVDICNDQILTALERINLEFINMEETLSTPKSSKAMPMFIDYYKDKIEYIRNSRENYNRIFDTISNEYNDYTNTIKEMVGGNNDK